MHRSLLVILLASSTVAAQDSFRDTGLSDLSPMPTVIDEDISATARTAYAKGQSLVGQGETAAAIVEFNRAIEADPSFAAGYVARARGLAKLKQTRLAIKSYSKALTVADDTGLRTAIHLERGGGYFKTNEFQKALDDFDRAAELQPASADIAYQRGRTLVNLAAEDFAAGIDTAGQKINEAIAAFNRTIEIQPDFAAALADRGTARADIGELDEAIEDLTKSNSLQGKASTSYRLAVLYLQRAASAGNDGAKANDQRQSDLQSAIRLLTSAKESPEDDVEVDTQPIDLNQLLLTRAVARIELASLPAVADREMLYGLALLDCQSVIKESPRIAAAHYQKAIILRLLGENRASVKAFTEAIKLAPENSEARLRRGIAWFYLDEYDLASDDFRAVGLLPGDARPMFWTGVIHAQRGDHLEAIRAYSEAISENRGYRLAYSNRALSLMHLGHWQRAIDDFNAMIQLNPDDRQAYHRRGLAQQQLGRDEEARRSFAKAQ